MLMDSEEPAGVLLKVEPAGSSYAGHVYCVITSHHYMLAWLHHDLNTHVKVAGTKDPETSCGLTVDTVEMQVAR